jgi:hypothetical protein
MIPHTRPMLAQMRSATSVRDCTILITASSPGASADGSSDLPRHAVASAVSAKRRSPAPSPIVTKCGLTSVIVPLTARYRCRSAEAPSGARAVGHAAAAGGRPRATPRTAGVGDPAGRSGGTSFRPAPVTLLPVATAPAIDCASERFSVPGGGANTAALSSRRLAKWLVSARDAPGHRSQQTAADFNPQHPPHKYAFQFLGFDNA